MRFRTGVRVPLSGFAGLLFSGTPLLYSYPLAFLAGSAPSALVKSSLSRAAGLPFAWFESVPWLPLSKRPQRAGPQRSLLKSPLPRPGKPAAKNLAEAAASLLCRCKVHGAAANSCIPQCLWIFFARKLTPGAGSRQSLSARDPNPRIGAVYYPVLISLGPRPASGAGARLIAWLWPSTIICGLARRDSKRWVASRRQSSRRWASSLR
jgi:hypothetical protein